MKKTRNPSPGTKMKKYYQLTLVIVCCVSVISLLIYRHEYYRLRYVLEVLNFFGKPGLSAVEFCGPGYNATMLTEILNNSSHEVRVTPPLFQQIDENFYTYSSFLRHNSKFDTLETTYVYETDTIAIGKATIEPKFRCNVWLEGVTKPKPAKFSYKLLQRTEDNQLYIFRCSMAKDLGKPVALSFYSNDHKVNPMFAPISQLIQVNTKRKMRENANIKFVNNVEIAACVMPNKLPLVSKSGFLEFLTFHQMMGVKQFIVYDSTITEDTLKRINLLPSDITKWKIQFFPLNYPFIFSKSYNIVRSAIEVDCVFRNLQTDKEVYSKTSHLLTLSWDEFIVPRYHHNLKALLGDFDPTRKLRRMEVSTLMFCLNQKDDLNVKEDYPEIIKKTTYYKIPNKNAQISILNLDTINSFEDIVEMSINANKTIPEDVLAIHKYTDCVNDNNYDAESPDSLQIYSHKFEGAILKFADEFHNNKIYRLFKRGQIWEKTSERIRDML